TNCLIKWCKTHEAACKKLFSDSMQDAWEEGRSKQQLHHGKNDIYVEIAKVIFSVGDDCLDVYVSPIRSLKQEYRKYITLLGQTGAGRTYDDLASNTSTKNIIGTSPHLYHSLSREFLPWGDLHSWWHTNPAYNSIWSGADSGQNFAAHAVRLFKLWSNPHAISDSLPGPGVTHQRCLVRWTWM
ncbi:hypothetical protein BKA82DRAFT_3983009, partial [Pisolithus tinctorius]